MDAGPISGPRSNSPMRNGDASRASIVNEVTRAAVVGAVLHGRGPAFARCVFPTGAALRGYRDCGRDATGS